MGNNLAKLQIQMQDEPSYQYIGGKDIYINVSMTVFGEKELLKIRSVFDHTNALARLEHSTGVIGFLGIKNIITALCGIKYVLPLNYKVDTIPNFPHVYAVQLSLVDFDIFQQQREKISSKQQTELIEHFGTKRNPFLRIKQLWGSFNAYPDLPLGVKNKEGDIVGNLDPDFYFRSFEMFDRDIINNTTTQVDLTKNFTFDSSDSFFRGSDNEIAQKKESVKYTIRNFLRRYSTTNAANAAAVDARVQTNEDLINEIIDYVNQSGISPHNFVSIFQEVINEANADVSKNTLLTDFIFLASQSSEGDPLFEEINGSPFLIGNVGVTNGETENMIKTILATSKLAEEEFVSFDPDEVEFHKMIYLMPLGNPEVDDPSELPAIMYTALGSHFGYINKDNGRFYLTADGSNVKIESDGAKKIESNYTKDMQTPDVGCDKSLTGISGAQPLSEYQKAYDGSFNNHMEKMLNDVQYRDISGRMLRAFPTYMLWLIDEGGMFAGVKLFDNFYGLQSVIDFSVVSSEDLLGDTLILRVSNMYSKLTTRPSTDIFNARNDNFNSDPLNSVDGISAILDRTLNIAKNIVSGMRNDYVVDINNIRLKPGVRVHLRGGYGSNPNSLQTLFNGVITNVEEGEIVTVTAQSDAIELGAVVNSTNKKGDSGKIDGGVDTGMYLSEPRDLMVRLLSMGTSRTREAFAHATRGAVFSENKFGIRHFGSILYEPLTEREKAQATQYRNTVSDVFNVMSNNPFTGTVGALGNSAVNVVSFGGIESAGGSVRTPVFGMMQMMWSNFSTQRDMEIFKRNIYPGNGLGISQFMGGDIDDGWSVLTSVDTNQLENEKFGYLDRLNDSSWNRLIQASEREMSPDASSVLGSVTASSKLVDSSKAIGTSQVLGGLAIGALLAPVGAIAAPAGITASIAGGASAAAGGTSIGGLLAKGLAGRGTANIFKTMGLVSDLDDDIYDEVSFRAQTYMRSVWDMFQLCARLLPNYIVAVRPFEDRSTIFYGKPHWLYTSGVYPISTGFHIESKDSDIEGPIWSSPDYVMNDIINQINKESTPLADSNAFSSLQESKLSGMMSTFAESSLKFEDIFQAGEPLNGQIINFKDTDRNRYYVD